MTRIRQWWCSWLHDKGYRIHAWEMIDERGSIRCRRCSVVREGRGPNGGMYMRETLAKYRAEGRL